MEEIIEELMQVDAAKDEEKEDAYSLFMDSPNFQGTIYLDLPEQVETLQNSSNDKYIVPIFTSDSMNTFVGNGVIVGTYPSGRIYNPTVAEY